MDQNDNNIIYTYTRIAADDCGYRQQQRRIRIYTLLNTSETVAPYVSDVSTFPEACMICHKATVWENRYLTDFDLSAHTIFQTRCTVCKYVCTFDAYELQKEIGLR